jgi:hypothetical protein
VNDRIVVEVVYGGREAVPELLFGAYADVAQDQDLRRASTGRGLPEFPGLGLNGYLGHKNIQHTLRYRSCRPTGSGLVEGLSPGIASCRTPDFWSPARWLFQQQQS